MVFLWPNKIVQITWMSDFDVVYSDIACNEDKISRFASNNIALEGQYFTLYKHDFILSFLLLLLLVNQFLDESKVT